MKVWIGPLGDLREVDCYPSVQVTPERSRDSFTGLSGKRTHFVGRRVYRTWAMSYVWSDPSTVEWLAQLASGGVVGPYYLWTSVAEESNLAPQGLQSGGSRIFNGVRVLGEDDHELKEWVVPLRPNTSYTLSFLSEYMASLVIRNPSGGLFASIIASAGGRTSNTFNSGSMTHIRVTPSYGMGQFRLTKGSHTGFRTGPGVPQVVVHDAEQTLQRVVAGDVRADMGVTLEETG